MIARILSLLLLVPAATPAATPGGVRMEHRFLWSEANAHVAGAQTREDFAAAAHTYRKLIAAGVRNGPVFYNLGLALMQAERYDEALDVFLRAERYAGSDEELVHNILICLARGREDQSISLPWYRFLLFWHFELSTAVRAAIAAGAFLLCWLALLLRLLQARSAAAQVFAGGLVFLILFGSSTATSLLQEYQSGLHDRTVLPEAEAEQAGEPPPRGPDERSGTG